MSALLLIAYFAVLGVLALLGLYRLLLTYAAVSGDRARRVVRPLGSDAPAIAVQIPLFNEAFVAERALRAAAALRYPEGRLEIQVLDDSTDETKHIVARVASELARQGHVIRVLRRDDRRGFKAGALAAGLAATDAELIAIFDADFIPDPDFLERVVPVLVADPQCGLVQARWTHTNRDFSWLTRAQAVFLDGHFAIEHCARDRAGCFFNFNGTAGVWRKSAIVAAGGWSYDTITEDLDLSYRAQLAGVRFRYLDQVAAPAELPERWSAFRSQQARWVRGSVETARKHFRALLFAKLPLAVRVDALILLVNNFAYLLMALLSLLLPLTVFIRAELAWRVPGGRALMTGLDVSMLGAGTCAMLVFYCAAQRRVGERLSVRRIFEILFALCLGVGISVQNAHAVLAGLFVRQAAFVRTAKRGDAPMIHAVATYRSRAPLGLASIELLFALYLWAGVAWAIDQRVFGALPFLIMYGIGFSVIGASALSDHLSLSRWRTSVVLRSSPSSEAVESPRLRGGG